MFDLISQCVIGFCGLGAIVLVNSSELRVRRWGPVLGMIAQPAWFYTTWQAEQYGIFVLSFFYTASWARGLYNFWLKEKTDV